MDTYIDVHFNRMGLGGRTLVVVAVGTDVYGATDEEPFTALDTVARQASADLVGRGLSVSPSTIVARGRHAWDAHGR